MAESQAQHSSDAPSDPTPAPAPAPAPATTTSSSETAQTAPPKSAADLPDAAIDLATKLFNLARSGSTTLLQPYLSAGIPPNLTNSTGDTLLMLAAYHGHSETVSVLLSFGADPNALNDRGQSPLAGAVFKGWDEVVKVLVKGGADVRAGHPNAVDCARMFRRPDLLELFGVGKEDGEESGSGDGSGGRKSEQSLEKRGTRQK